MAAGFIVFLPKAWDVVLNPIAGRISDRTVDPRGPRRPWLLRGGLRWRSRSRCSSPRPTWARQVLEAAWVLVFFLACATAYAFFQVPYVAMPAEMTASYDERTRLMTWRVAILAFTIMLAGATRAGDPRRGRRPRRLPGDGPGDGAGDPRGRRGRRLPRHPARPGRRGRSRARARCATSCGSWPARATSGCCSRRSSLQALATGCMLAGVDYARADVLDRQGRGDDPVRLLRRAGAAAHARRGPRSAPRVGKKRGYVAASLVLAAGALLAVLGPVGARTGWCSAPTALVGVGYAGCQVFPLAMLPDAAAVDARRTGRTGSASTPASGRPARRSASRSGRGCSRWCWRSAATGRRTDGDVAQPDSALTAIVLGFSVLPGGARRCSACVWLRRYTLDADARSTAAEARRRRHDDDVLARLQAMQAGDLPVHGGRTLAYVYDSGLPEVDRVGREAVAAYAGSNGLDPTAFPSLLRDGERPRRLRLRPARRARRARSARSPPAAPSRCCSPCRRRATRTRTSTGPRMVLPATAHAAFHKAAHYFGVEAVLVAGRCRTSGPTPDDDGARRSTDRTVLVVASAPSYAHGVVDPVTETRGARGRARRAAATSTRASAAGCCRTPRGSAAPSRRGRSRSRASPHLGRPAQVRLRTQGHLAAAAPDPGAAAAAVLRQRRLAGLHDAQLDDAVDEVGRSAGRRLGGRRTRSATRATSS